jgi:phage replication O-like protein O
VVISRSGTPQLEDGFTKIADELLEALCSVNLGGRELSLVLAIIRKTYGWRKKKDHISGSQLAKLTGIPRKKIPTLLRSLEAKNIVCIESHGQGRTATLSIKKDHRKWLKRDISTAPLQRGSSETNMPPVGGKLQTAPLLGPTAPLQGGSTAPLQGAHNREIENTIESTPTIFGKLKLRLSPKKVAALISMRPGGKLYTEDEVQAWFLATEPVMIAKGYKSTVRCAVNWFRNVKPEEIRKAIGWVETQAMEELRDQEDTREKDSIKDFAEAFGL